MSASVDGDSAAGSNSSKEEHTVKAVKEEPSKTEKENLTTAGPEKDQPSEQHQTDLVAAAAVNQLNHYARGLMMVQK